MAKTNINTAKFLDWVGSMDFAHYKTEATPTYKPSGPTHWYIKGSPDRFSSAELVKIYSGEMSKSLRQRWNEALADGEKYKKGY